MSRDIKIRENVSLAPFTTFKVGGDARLFTTAATQDQILQAVNFADENDFDIFMLGGGSNVLISDNGFDGLVVQIATKGIELNETSDNTIEVIAQAGEDWDEFVEHCVIKNLAGLECLSGIPGLVGATPIQNVGAYGQEVSETISKVKVFDRKNKELLELSNQDCKFEYRKSIFNTNQKDRFVVLEVTYLLKKYGNPKLVYKDLLNHFSDATPKLIEVRNAVRKIRAEKAMLVRQGGLDSQSAGSFFKNPIISKDQFIKLEEKLVDLELINEKGEIPNYRIGQDLIKIPAAWLIEKAGFSKGFQKGNVGLSTKHTLALTNRGGATAEDIIDLKADIQNKIKELYQIDLTPETNFIGFA